MRHYLDKDNNSVYMDSIDTKLSIVLQDIIYQDPWETCVPRKRNDP